MVTNVSPETSVSFVSRYARQTALEWTWIVPISSARSARDRDSQPFRVGRFLVHHVRWCFVRLVVFINTGTTPYRTGTCKNFTLVVIIWYITYKTKMRFLPRCLEIFLCRRVRKIAKSVYQLPHVCLSFRPSVRMEQLSFHRTDFHENWYLNIFRKSVEKIQFELEYDKIMGTLHEDPCTFTITSRWILLRRRNVSDKRRENQNITFYVQKHFPVNRAVSETIWEKNSTVGQAVGDNIIWRMHIACWKNKASNTHLEFVTLIAFPW